MLAEMECESWKFIRKIILIMNMYVVLTVVPGTPLILLCLLTYLNAVIILILLIRKQMHWRYSTLSNLAQLVSGETGI